MKQSITVKPKPIGRPPTGRDPLVAARFPPELIAKIDAWAKGNAKSRSDAMRNLIELGLKGKR